MSRTHHARKPRVRRVCACGRREERCAEMLRERANRALHASAVKHALRTARGPSTAFWDQIASLNKEPTSYATLDVRTGAITMTSNPFDELA